MASRIPSSPSSIEELIRQTVESQLQRIRLGGLDDEITNSSEDQLGSSLGEKCRIPDPMIKIDEWKATVTDTADGSEVKYFIPFEGPAYVAHLIAPKYVTGGELVRYSNGWEFRIARNGRNAEQVRSLAGQIIDDLRVPVAKGEQSISNFNAHIEDRLKDAAAARRREIENRDRFVDDLNRRD